VRCLRIMELGTGGEIPAQITSVGLGQVGKKAGFEILSVKHAFIPCNTLLLLLRSSCVGELEREEQQSVCVCMVVSINRD
jgi:hypothetical protein